MSAPARSPAAFKPQVRRIRAGSGPYPGRARVRIPRSHPRVRIPGVVATVPDCAGVLPVRFAADLSTARDLG
ncbi:MAG: hypothetical protein OXU61_02030 [Gammaproteobacteria bacterium]|nr:hypothetical protein [Gammaproteobacteria bacterium]